MARRDWEKARDRRAKADASRITKKTLRSVEACQGCRTMLLPKQRVWTRGDKHFCPTCGPYCVTE